MKKLYAKHIIAANPKLGEALLEAADVLNDETNSWIKIKSVLGVVSAYLSEDDPLYAKVSEIVNIFSNGVSQISYVRRALNGLLDSLTKA